jgi:hypothetical protein
MSTNSPSNGVSNRAFVPVPLREPEWQFSGLGGPHEVTKLKEVVSHDLRLYGLEKFLEQDIAELAPNTADYDITIPSERRLLAADKLRVVEDAARAWTLVRNRFKAGSPAEALVKPTEHSGALNVLWKIFTTQYDNRTNRRGALEIMQKFFDNDIKYNNDLIANFIFLQDTIQEIQTLAIRPDNMAQVGISTPLRTSLDFRSDTDRTTRFTSINAPTSTFPGWFPTILLLMRLAQMPNHREFIKKFIFEYLVKNNNQKLEDISISQCYEQLKTYTTVWNQGGKSNADKSKELSIQVHQTIANEEKAYFCSHHGPNSTHSTQRCYAINKLSLIHI